eukprot:CAMPEP_0170651864 /NCGR_PEP_ID=MMETSP0224-20130122/46591_1 /TAXON_ID=285029 /ORGANISM="Togula jolla, Strain CCCM 725" /LENGTH=42 /DNA_ID= /DNA_START= /DNA_END= /DNA_ORIENTATION=
MPRKLREEVVLDLILETSVEPVTPLCYLEVARRLNLEGEELK